MLSEDGMHNMKTAYTDLYVTINKLLYVSIWDKANTGQTAW